MRSDHSPTLTSRSARGVMPVMLACSLVTATGQDAQQRANPHQGSTPDPAMLDNPATGPTPPLPAERAAPASPDRGASSPTPTTRIDMAASFMRFERALEASKPDGEDLLRANTEFDDATIDFFRGSGARAVATLDAGTIRMSGLESHPVSGVAPWLRVRVDPPVWTYYSNPAPSITVRAVSEAPPWPDPVPALSISIDPVDIGGDDEAAGHDGGAMLGAPSTPPRPRGVQINIPDLGAVRTVGGVTLDLSAFVKSLPPARYRVRLVGDRGFRWALGEWTVVSAPRADIHASLLEKIDIAEKLHGADPSLRDAFCQFRARLATLKDRPSEARPSEFLADQNVLESELVTEARALSAGTNPYLLHPGLLYGAFRSGTPGAPVSVPLWTFAPAAATAPDARPALVIALHGAGADESMFMFGYGRGMLRDLAQEKGFVIAAPLAYAFIANPAVFDDLLSAMKARYHIDPARVYVMGHSMGAIAASGLAQARSKSIAAVAAIAGLRPFTPDAPSAPVLAYAAERDRIIPARRVRANGEAAQKSGHNVVLRVASGQGHILVVSAVMRECVEWLLEQHPHTNKPEAPAKSAPHTP